ncbi:MAG: bestrophin family protein [Methylosarcina sp.]
MNKDASPNLTNQEESVSFLRGALMWRGSATPVILSSLVLFSLYPFTLVLLDHYLIPLPHFKVTPFEYTGVVLGLVLVFRTNSGYDRWWEARKLWGSIVNSCRNILIAGLNYGPANPGWRRELVKWIIVFPYATKESLRQTKDFTELEEGILTAEEIQQLKSAQHMALFVVDKIASLFQEARMGNPGLSDMSFLELERQRATLIDCLGGCERILKTPMPLAYGIKVRRFILIFLLLLPFSLLDKAGFYTVFIFFLVAYPLLALDRIGLDLQYPFNLKRLSHLPLNGICNTIKANGLVFLARENEAAQAGRQTRSNPKC